MSAAVRGAVVIEVVLAGTPPWDFEAEMLAGLYWRVSAMLGTPLLVNPTSPSIRSGVHRTQRIAVQRV